MVELDQVSPETLKVVQGSRSIKAFRQDGNRLYLSIDDPASENPEIVAALVRSGARIIHVEEVKKGLEDVYLRIVGGEGKCSASRRCGPSPGRSSPSSGATATCS
jgi:hypothetical protein